MVFIDKYSANCTSRRMVISSVQSDSRPVNLLDICTESNKRRIRHSRSSSRSKQPRLGVRYFCEGRFNSQAILDEKALIACMTYIDLSPVRVGIAPIPEESADICVKLGIDALRSQRSSNPHHHNPLLAMHGRGCHLDYHFARKTIWSCLIGRLARFGRRRLGR